MLRTPYSIARTPIIQFLKTFYKKIAYESLSKCSRNAPDMNIERVLTKRLIIFDNCFISNENLPSYLRNGYYKIILKFEGPAAMDVILLIKVEPLD